MGSVFGRLRGWGGVTAMGVACAVTAALTVVPLAHHAAGSSAAGPVGAEAPHRADDASSQTLAPAADEPCPGTGQPPQASVPASSAGGPTIDKMLAREGDKRKLIVGVDQNSYHWGYLNPATNKFEGFDIDLARAIAKNIFGSDQDIQFKPVSTDQRITALNNGSVDIVVRTMTISCLRITQASFSTAYYKAGQQVLAPKASGIKGYDTTIEGKRVCTATGSTAVQQLEDSKNPHHVVFWDKSNGKGYNPRHVNIDDLSVPNQLDCLVRLQLGLVDAVITDNALAAAQAAQDPAVELKGTPFTTEYYGVAAKRGNTDLVARVNDVLKQYRSGGPSPWTRSYDKWLKTGPDDRTQPPVAQYLPST